VPQIPLHIDRNWEGAPEPELRLFRISIEGVRENDSKIAFNERMAKRKQKVGEEQSRSDDLRDFTVAVALGVIRRLDHGYHIEDPDLPEEKRKLGKFRDQAFANYGRRIDAQKQWIRRAVQSKISELMENREFARLISLLDAHATDIEKLVKLCDADAGAEMEHLHRELASFIAFRKEIAR
jgi:hypothetical protein